MLCTIPQCIRCDSGNCSKCQSGYTAVNGECKGELLTLATAFMFQLTANKFNATSATLGVLTDQTKIFTHIKGIFLAMSQICKEKHDCDSTVWSKQ